MSVAIRGVSLTTRDARISFILRAILRERCGPTRNGTNTKAMSALLAKAWRVVR